jgi:hypothetical protein
MATNAPLPLAAAHLLSTPIYPPLPYVTTAVSLAVRRIGRRSPWTTSSHPLISSSRCSPYIGTTSLYCQEHPLISSSKLPSAYVPTTDCADPDTQSHIPTNVHTHTHTHTHTHLLSHTGGCWTGWQVCLCKLDYFVSLVCVRGLFAACSRPVRGLFAVCSRSVRGLFAVCSRSVRGLFAVCSRSVRVLFAFCSRSVRVLFAFCSRSVRGLFAVCSRPVRPCLPWVCYSLPTSFSFRASVCPETHVFITGRTPSICETYACEAAQYSRALAYTRARNVSVRCPHARDGPCVKRSVLHSPHGGGGV